MPIFGIFWSSNSCLLATWVKIDVFVEVFGDKSQRFGRNIPKSPRSEGLNSSGAQRFYELELGVDSFGQLASLPGSRYDGSTLNISQSAVNSSGSLTSRPVPSFM